MTIIQTPAHENNYSKGRGGKVPNKIILHWIVGSLSSADNTFQRSDRRVSSHYGIEDETIHQYVNEDNTAWHASNFVVNQESIGIEHSGGELLPDETRRKPSNKTHETSARLVRDICDRYSIPIDKRHIFPHNKYSPTECPGSLDIDRIVQLAKLDQLAEDELVITLQTRIPQILDVQGNPMEVQTVRSKINDLSRDLENERNTCDSKVNKIKVEYERLLLRKVSDFDAIDLFRLGFKKLFGK